MAFRRTFNPTLDGGLVNIGDGTAKKQAVRVESGEYTPPIWLRTESGVVIPVTELPWQGVLEAGQMEVLPEAPGALGTISDLSVDSTGETTATLSWGDVEGATSYQPQYRTAGGGSYTDFGSSIGTGVGTVQYTGLTTDQEYDFRIVASDGSSTTNSNVVQGTPSGVSPVFVSTFEDGTKTADHGGSWGAVGAGDVTEAAARTGTYGLDVTCLAGESNEQRGALSGQYPELWIERWIYIGDEYDHQNPGLPNNNKFFALWGREYGTSNRAKIVIEVTPVGDTGDSNFRFMANPDGGGTSFNVGSEEVGGTTTSVSPGIADSGDALIRGQWTRFRYHVDIGSGPGEGVIQAWVGDTLIFDESGLNLYPDEGSNEHAPYFDEFYLWGATNSDYVVDTPIYEDDIRFYDTDPGWDD